MLEQYKGCDILDINPGACLWSQKLHDFLKPRSHVLLEPSPDLFKTYLDPLLDAPGSTYKLVSKDPLHLGSYREMVEEGVFEHQTRVDPEGPDAQKPNNTLLVTGSLAWEPRLPGMAFDSMAKQIFFHFASAAWSNDLFHAFGPVRTLLWVQSDDFRHMIAQSSSNFHKASRMLEMTQNMNLVVGSEVKERLVGRGAIGREPQLEIESTIKALQVGKEHGMVIPEHRQGPAHLYATKLNSDGSGKVSYTDLYEFIYNQHLAGTLPSQYAARSLIELFELEKEIQSTYPDISIPPLFPVQDLKGRARAPSLLIPENHPINDTDLMHRWRLARPAFGQQYRIRVKINALADIGEEMYKLECAALRCPPGPEQDRLIAQVQDLDAQWEHDFSQIPRNKLTAPGTVVDDRISLRFPPYDRLQWDARPFDPLMSQEDEAWPPTRLGLVLATPIPRPEGDDKFYEWVADFVHGLYTDTGKDLAAALETMHHGLSDIIKDCPTLRNPDLGGRMQMKHFRVRMLTMPQVCDMVRAYTEWPFKVEGAHHSTYYRSGKVKLNYM
jgi:transcription factor 1